MILTKQQIELNFTKEEGLKIQENHLLEFKCVMSSNAFDMLKELVTKGNDDAKTGFDIKRGTDIEDILLDKVIPHFMDR